MMIIDYFLGLVLSCSPFAPVSGTGTGFDSSPIKGEGDLVGLSCCQPSRLPSGLRIKSAMT